MTPEEVYDTLQEHGIGEPAVLMLGDTHYIGMWVLLSETLGAKQLITRSKGKGILVLGRGADLASAVHEAVGRLEAAAEHALPLDGFTTCGGAGSETKS